MRIVRFILLLILALFCMAAAVLLTIDGNLSRITGRLIFDKGERLFPLSEESAANMSWMRVEDHQNKVECARNPQGLWWMTSPCNDRMDPRAAAAILYFAYSSQVVDTVPNNNVVRGSMKDFGVETNPIKFTLKTKTGEDRHETLARFTLGASAPWLVDDPTNKRTLKTSYLRTDFYGRDKRIQVVTGDLQAWFKDGVMSLRDHRPFCFHPMLARAVEIEQGGKKIKVERAYANTPWYISAPLHVETDEKAVTQLVNVLQQITATRLVDADASPLPKVDEKLLTKVSLTLENQKEPVVLTIYPPDSPSATVQRATISDRNVIFELPIISFEIPSEIATAEPTKMPGVRSLPLTLASLRTKQFAKMDVSQVIGLSLRAIDQEFPVIVRMMEGEVVTDFEKKWLYSAGGALFKPANAAQIAAIIYSLTEMPVLGFPTDMSDVDMATYGLASPQLVLTLAFRNAPPRSFIFGRGADKMWYAREEGKPSIYQIDRKVMMALMVNPLQWLPPRVITFSRADLKQLVLTRAKQDPLVLDYEYFDDNWRATQAGKDVTSSLNASRATRYLMALELLAVDRWVAADDPQALAALENPAFTIDFVLDEPIENQGLLEVDITAADADKKLKDAAMKEVKTQRVVKQISIAPNTREYEVLFYYGKVSGMKEPFIISMDKVRLLAAPLLE